MNINILVTGDIHIGKRSSAIPDGQAQAATKHTWRALVDYALANPIDIVVLTGDIIDRDNRFFEAANPLQSGLRELNNNGIEVYIVSGNHDFDVLPQVVDREPLPHVHLLGRNGRWEDALFTKGENRIQFIGWSFPKQHFMEDPTQSLNPLVIEKDIPTIALVHGDAYNLSRTSYAPMNKERLNSFTGIDAWLLGHIHRPDIVSDKNPLILYPGSPHALSPKERDEHGPYILTVNNRDIQSRQLPFSPVRYEYLPIDISEVVDRESVKSIIVEQLNAHSSTFTTNERMTHLVYDLSLQGKYADTNSLHGLEEELADFEGMHSFYITIRKIGRNIQAPINIEELAKDPSYIGVLANTVLLLRNGGSNAFIDQLIDSWKHKYHTLSSSTAYQHLKKPIDDEKLNTQARQAILSECNDLISQLVYSKDHEV